MGTLYLRGRLIAAAERLQAAGSADEMRACLRTQHRFWRLFKRRLRTSCCKSPEFLRLADFVLTALKDGKQPDERLVAALVSINMRASALIAQDCLLEAESPIRILRARVIEQAPQPMA